MSAAIAEDVTVVLLPGLDGTGQLFESFVSTCPAGYRTLPVAYPADRHASVAELAVQVQSAVPRARWMLLAESFSGMVAIHVAAARPGGLLGMVLVATAAKWSRLRWLTPLPLASLFAIEAPTPALKWLLLGDASPALITATRKAISSVTPRVLASRLRELAATDVRPLLEQIDVPVLYLQARHDRLARRAELLSIQSRCAQVEVRVLDGPHFLVQSAPTTVWQHLVSFERSRRIA